MNGKMVRLLRLRASPAAAVLLAVTFACNSRHADQAPSDSREPPGKTAVPYARSDPGINLECVAHRIQKAPAPFHWSYKKEVIGLSAADWEADITPNAIAGTFIDSSGAHAIDGARSDRTSWDSAVMILTWPLPASTFALVNNSSAIVRNGIENENGQNAIKYTIDTTQATGGETGLIKSVVGANGFIKGAAWVTPQGCPVKFVLDVEQYNTDGTVEREHHEANITKP